MKRIGKSLGVGVAVALAAGIVPAPSVALHSIPPTARLRNNGEIEQRGLVQGYCWPSHDGGAGCYTTGRRDWPAGVAVPSDQRIRIRFRKRAELKRVTIDAYARVRDDGMPAGDRDRLKKRIKPYERDGDVFAWDAIFELPRPDRHYYLSVFAYWRKGHIVYHFHAKT